MAQAKRKKKFFSIELPIIKKDTQVQAYEIDELNGRFIKYDLTRLLKGKSILIQVKIEVKDGKPITVPKQIQLLPYYLRRMMRKGTNYVEDSFSTNCKDAQIRIKPFLITRRKVSRAVRKTLRNKAKEEIISYVKSKTANSLFEEILKNKLQKDLSLKLKKIYPLSLCEIRIFKVEKRTENKKQDSEKESEKEKKKGE